MGVVGGRRVVVVREPTHAKVFKERVGSSLILMPR